MPACDRRTDRRTASLYLLRASADARKNDRTADRPTREGIEVEDNEGVAMVAASLDEVKHLKLPRYSHISSLTSVIDSLSSSAEGTAATSHFHMIFYFPLFHNLNVQPTNFQN